jgi:phospholipid/cholesterol/gamma-HCH transport system substrate-binding protein
MNERQMQFRVGVVVFATMIIGGLLATLNEPLLTGWLPWGRFTYSVGIALREAPGVAPNTPVRKNGILIGRVESIEDKGDGVLLKATIDGDRPLYEQYEPEVRTSVLGDATIDFTTVPVPQGAQPVPDGYVFSGDVAPNPFDAIADFASLKDEFGSAARSLGEAGDEVSKLAERVNKAFGDETEEGRVDRLLETTERAMNQFAATMTAFNEIIGDVPAEYASQPVDVHRLDVQPPFQSQPPLNGQPPTVAPQQRDVPAPVGPRPPGAQPPGAQPPIEGAELRRRVRQGLNELPDAVREARITMEQFRGTLELADRNLRNLEGFTEPLGQKGEAITDALIRAVDGVDRLVEDFNVLVQALNNREGTIGRLIHEPQTYENLNRLMCNANTVLEQIYQLAQRLRPVVEDARVLMDKIAREPGRIVTGGLNPSPIK